MSKRKRGLFWMWKTEGDCWVQFDEPCWLSGGYRYWEDGMAGALCLQAVERVFGLRLGKDAVLIDLTKFDPRRPRACVVRSKFPPETTKGGST